MKTTNLSDKYPDLQVAEPRFHEVGCHFTFHGLIPSNKRIGGVFNGNGAFPRMFVVLTAVRKCQYGVLGTFPITEASPPLLPFK